MAAQFRDHYHALIDAVNRKLWDLIEDYDPLFGPGGNYIPPNPVSPGAVHRARVRGWADPVKPTEETQ